MVVFGKKWLYYGRLVVFEQTGCNRAKMVSIRGKVVVVLQKWLYSGKSGCVLAESVVFGKNGCIRRKDVVNGKKFL